MERTACPLGFLVRIFVFVCLMLAHGAVSAASGLDWLLSHSQPDGGFSAAGDTATRFQSSAEAVRAIIAQGHPDSSSLSSTLQFLQADGSVGTEHLSRKIIALAETGGDPVGIVAELAASQDVEGGFGESVGFNASVVDTAMALEALALAGHGDSSTFAAAVAFLADRRVPDGGWGPGPKQPASAYVTAQVLRGLWPLRHRLDVSALLTGARSFLFSAQDADGGWNANALETAAALAALYPTLQDKTPLDAARQRLLGWKHSDGSWGHDVFVTALALRALAAADEPFADLGVVEGSVIDGDTGSPLAGVSVTLTGEQSWSTVTGASGTFQLEDLEPGTYELRLSLEGYAPLTASLQLQVGTRASFGTLQMLPAVGSTQTATVTGQVTRADTGAGLSDVTVRVSGTESETVTDSEGRYQLVGLAPGTVTLVASKAGFRSASASAALTEGQVALFSPALSVAQTGVSVEGTVTRAADATPVPGATINIQDVEGTAWNATTDASGYYRIDGLSTGSYTLTAEAEGYWPVSGEVSADSETVIRFAPTLTELSSEAPVPETSGGVRVTVRDAATGQAVAGATVAVETDEGTVTQATSVEGEATLTGVPDGPAILSIAATGFDHWQSAIEVAPGVLLDFSEIELYPVGYRDLASLSGTAIDAATGSPLEGVNVTASYADGSTTTVTGADGSFLIDGLTETEAELQLQKAGYRPVQLGLVITPGTVLELGSLRMRPEAVSELKPDLVVAELDVTGTESDPLDFSFSGEVAVRIANEGTATATGPVTALAFHDVDGDGLYSSANDLLLGTGAFSSDLAVGTDVSVAIPVDGTVPFRDAPIRVWIDSSETSVELSEQNNYAGNAGQCAGPEEAVALDLAMCMDASGSVSWGEFQLQLEGTAAAIENPEIVPHDGSVRLSALQFSSWTRVEVPPTIITEENATQVAKRIRSIRKLGGGTSIHSCINTAVSKSTSASPSSAIKVIDVSTDGDSSRYYAIQASERAARPVSIR